MGVREAESLCCQVCVERRASDVFHLDATISQTEFRIAFCGLFVVGNRILHTDISLQKLPPIGPTQAATSVHSPRHAAALHVVGQRHVVAPHVELPLAQAQHAAQHVAGVNADAHVHIEAGRLANKPAKPNKTHIKKNTHTHHKYIDASKGEIECTRSDGCRDAVKKKSTTKPDTSATAHTELRCPCTRQIEVQQLNYISAFALWGPDRY